MISNASPIALAPAEHAVQTALSGPLSPNSSETCAAAMFGSIIGAKNGLRRLGPSVSSTRDCCSNVPSPPTPLPTTAPMSSGSAATSSPASLRRLTGRRDRVLREGSMRRAARFSMKSSGSKPLTSPAMRDVRREASNLVMAPMPLSPASKPVPDRLDIVAQGQMMPDPVMTTRRGPSFMPVSSACSPASARPFVPVNPSPASPAITPSAGGSSCCQLLNRERIPVGDRVSGVAGKSREPSTTTIWPCG